jgi:hypothetical protein
MTPVTASMRKRTQVMVPSQSVEKRLRPFRVTYAGKTWRRKFLTTESDASLGVRGK